MSLQEKLIMLRKEKELSQFDVSEALRVSRQAVSRWEAGTAQPSTDNLKVLSKLYKVSVDYLLDDDADRPEPPEEETQAAKTPTASGKRFTLERKRIVALSCAVVLLLALLIYTAMPKDVEEEVPIIPIGELEEVEETDDGTPYVEFSLEWP